MQPLAREKQKELVKKYGSKKTKTIITYLYPDNFELRNQESNAQMFQTLKSRFKSQFRRIKTFINAKENRNYRKDNQLERLPPCNISLFPSSQFKRTEKTNFHVKLQCYSYSTVRVTVVPLP